MADRRVPALALLAILAAPAIQAQTVADDSTGMESCDAFLAAYASCAASPGVPAAARPGIQQGIAGMRTSFRDGAASSPRARSTLAKQCVQTHDQVRQRMQEAFKCDFPAPTLTADQAAAQTDAAPPLAPPLAPSRRDPPAARAAPVQSAAQQEAAKANAYTEVQNDIVSHHPMRRELAEHVTNNERVLRLGTRLGANAWYLFGIGDFDGVIKRLEAAIALPGQVAAVDGSAARLLETLQALNPVIKALDRYQTTREFKEDGFKFAREQQPILVARMQDAIKASTLFGDELFNRRMEIDERRVTALPADSLARHLLGTSLAARRLVRRYDATDAPADLPPFRESVAALVASNKALIDAMAGMKEAPDSACRDYSGDMDTLVGRARDYARDVQSKSSVNQTSGLFVTAYNRSIETLMRCRKNEARAEG